MRFSQKAQEKMRKCKALQGVSVLDLLHKQEFIDNLNTLLSFQKNLRDKAQKAYIKQINKPAPAHPVDKFLNYTAEQFRDEYEQILIKVNKRPAAERLYIEQLSKQAYNLTLAEILLKEFPELKDDLFPTTTQN